MVMVVVMDMGGSGRDGKGKKGQWVEGMKKKARDMEEEKMMKKMKKWEQERMERNSDYQEKQDWMWV